METQKSSRKSPAYARLFPQRSTLKIPYSIAIKFIQNTINNCRSSHCMTISDVIPVSTVIQMPSDITCVNALASAIYIEVVPTSIITASSIAPICFYFYFLHFKPFLSLKAFFSITFISISCNTCDKFLFISANPYSIFSKIINYPIDHFDSCANSTIILYVNIAIT